jgi:hypothetical protein
VVGAQRERADGLVRERADGIDEPQGAAEQRGIQVGLAATDERAGAVAHAQVPAAHGQIAHGFARLGAPLRDGRPEGTPTQHRVRHGLRRALEDRAGRVARRGQTDGAPASRCHEVRADLGRQRGGRR